MRDSRPISWLRGARKSFEAFPDEVQETGLSALTVAAEGQKPEAAKPLKGLGSGVFEIALRHRGEAYRIIYALQLDDALWVVHAFHKKSKKGIATPKPEIEVIKQRLKRLKEALQ